MVYWLMKHTLESRIECWAQACFRRYNLTQASDLELCARSYRQIHNILSHFTSISYALLCLVGCVPSWGISPPASLTCCGTLKLVCEPNPSCLASPLPHVHRLLSPYWSKYFNFISYVCSSPVTAAIWDWPIDTERTSDESKACTSWGLCRSP